MNTTKFSAARYAALLLMAVFLLAACNGPKKMSKALDKVKFKPDPEVLEVRGDSVQIKITGHFPAKTFAKNAQVKFQPVLRYGTDEMPLKPMYLLGEKVKNVPDGEYARIKYKSGGSFTYIRKVEYIPEMKNSNLTLDYTVKFNAKYDELQQCKSGSKDSAVRGTITTALLVKPTDDVYYYDNATPQGGFRKVIFYYVINEGKLRDSVMKGPAVAELRKFASDTTFRFTYVSLNAYASPDGEFAHNGQLCKERAQSAFNLVKKEFRRMHLDYVTDSAILQRPDMNSEDWEGLKRLVGRSDMAGKDDVLGVVNSNMSVEDKEAALRKLPSWDLLKSNILPRLRRTEVVLYGSFPNRKVEDLRALSNQSLDQLTEKEVILLANNTPDTAGKAKIYKYMMTKYPNDWGGTNNYAAILIKEGQYKMADSILTDLYNKNKDNDTIANNLGVARRFSRKYNDSKALYQQAQAGGLKENNNLGILYIKYGDYDNSVASFEPTRCDFNTALAYCLKGDYETALSKVECIEDKTADVFYLRAIIAARKGDKDLMTTSLTRAIQMDQTLRDMAKDDLEFRNYKKTPEFQNAIR
jgi:tetratricopeptide (TPR) repeat protein